jgi:3-hydroxyisobutyrate dehydrogenase-like beta-hydroxyacid dehydrogenase
MASFLAVAIASPEAPEASREYQRIGWQLLCGEAVPFTVGWIGVGKVGGAICRRLIASGHTVWVLDPNRDNLESLVSDGARRALTIGGLTETVETVFATIPNDVSLESIVFGPDGLAQRMPSGSTIVEMSTVSPSISRRVAEALSKRDVNYLRAPVSGSTATATAGALTVMASGPRLAFERVEGYLKAFSTLRFYVGDEEQARYLKLVVNTLVGAMLSLLSEALSLGDAGGLTRGDMLAVLSESVVASPLLGYKREMLEKDDYDPAFSVGQMIKDFVLVGDAAHEQHVPMRLAALVREHYEQAFAAGDGERDFFVLCRDAPRSGSRASDNASQTPPAG